MMFADNDVGDVLVPFPRQGEAELGGIAPFCSEAANGKSGLPGCASHQNKRNGKR